MVRDNETGLIWEVKQKLDGVKNYDNPNDADNTYTWAESNKKFIDALNTAHLGGFSDWRLPTIDELKTLIDISKTKPAINTDYFPNTQSSFYWSSTTYAFSTSYAWGVPFTYGGANHVNKGNSYYVRAVRGGQ
jgi:lysozyme family protein